MQAQNGALAFALEGWQNYQEQLRAAVASLTADQLALRPAPHLRTVGELVLHIIDTRAGWGARVLRLGGPEFAAYEDWQVPETSSNPVADLVQALDDTWKVLADAVRQFTLESLDETLQAEDRGKTYTFKRGWVLWHLVEHDLHHGGELSWSLGMNSLKAIDI